VEATSLSTLVLWNTIVNKPNHRRTAGWTHLQDSRLLYHHCDGVALFASELSSNGTGARG